MIKTYSLQADGESRLSANFKVKEFRCKDGSDEILIDTGLVDILQAIRSAYNKPLNINSAYRTESYNEKIGGSTTSKHCLGRACDFYIRDGYNTISAYKIACVAECMGVKGIEIINASCIHLDTRESGSWHSVQGRNLAGVRIYTKIEDMGYKSFFGLAKIPNVLALECSCPFNTPTKTLQKGSTGTSVRWLQWHLNRLGYLPIMNNGVNNIDGKFGTRTENALLQFQKDANLEVDGKCGGQTRKVLNEK